MFKRSAQSALVHDQQTMIYPLVCHFLDFQMSYSNDCAVSFHGYAVSANDENVIRYQSKENPDERRSRLITTSNVTIVLMSNTVVNRGGTSEMQHVINGENVTLSVIDGQCSDDVGVFLITVATADFGGSTFEIKNRKTHFHITSCTLTAFCTINGMYVDTILPYGWQNDH